MPLEPAKKRLVAFVDGQALYHAAKEAFGYDHPNYDVQLLCDAIAAEKCWNLAKIYFYTGIHEWAENSFWHDFWTNKLAMMSTRNIEVFKRYLRYADEEITCEHGKTVTVRVPREKGIDVRIALDVVRLALSDSYDVGLILSQDQDLSEAVTEVNNLVRRKRWIKLASAFPVSPTTKNDRGIDGTDVIRFGKSIYDACLDPIDYRPKSTTSPSTP